MSRTKIDNGLWTIKRYMMQRYGCDVADREMYPLEWYVHTGRASTDFLNRLLSAKPFMIARRLHKGGSDDEIISRIKDFLKVGG